MKHFHPALAESIAKSSKDFPDVLVNRNTFNEELIFHSLLDVGIILGSDIFHCSHVILVGLPCPAQIVLPEPLGVFRDTGDKVLCELNDCRTEDAAQVPCEHE